MNIRRFALTKFISAVIGALLLTVDNESYNVYVTTHLAGLTLIYWAYISTIYYFHSNKYRIQTPGGLLSFKENPSEYRFAYGSLYVAGSFIYFISLVYTPLINWEN